MGDKKKRFRVELPVLGEQIYYVLADTHAEALERATAGDWEHVEDIKGDEFEGENPSAINPAEVYLLSGEGSMSPENWEAQEAPGNPLRFMGDAIEITNTQIELAKAYLDNLDLSRSSDQKTNKVLKKETAMGRMQAALDTVKSDALNAGIRAGAAEFADTVREPVAAALMKELGMENKSISRVLGVFLSTSIGEGVFNYALGTALPLISMAVPNETASAMIAKLGEELRVAGQATMLRPLIRALREPVMQFVYAKLNPKERIRVKPDLDTPEEQEEEVESKTATTKRARR